MQELSLASFKDCTPVNSVELGNDIGTRGCHGEEEKKFFEESFQSVENLVESQKPFFL